MNSLKNFFCQNRQLIVVACLALAACSALAQGALTPPGAPAPTMKSLAQIEPRTPISSAPFTISAPGSYYLTTNVTVSAGDAITIAANNVTLDLNGFTIASTQPIAATSSAILLNAVTNIAIYNGHISSGVTITGGVFGGGGFGNGIYFPGYPPFNVRVKDVSVAGVLNSGIYLGIVNSTVVESCTVNVAGNSGILADSVSDSTVLNCGNVGITARTAQNCKGQSVGYSFGLSADTANNCFGENDGNGTGLIATTANNCYGFGGGGGLSAITANDCYGECDTGTGLYADAVATGCYGYSSSDTGLAAFIASVCHGATGSGTALSVTHNVNSF